MKIGVLAAVHALPDTYSVSRVIWDQLAMLKRFHGRPSLICQTDMQDIPSWCDVHPILPAWAKKDYSEQAFFRDDPQGVEACLKLYDALGAHLRKHRYDALLCHDLLFTGWNLPLANAIRRIVDESPELVGRWLHWVHSVPSSHRKDFWQLHPNSFLVYPNDTDRIRVAEGFRASPKSILTIPHEVSMFAWYDTPHAVREYLDHFEVLDADVISVFPVSADRISSKGLHHAVRVMGAIKANQNLSVKMVVIPSANTVASTEHSINSIRALGSALNLNARELLFTSDWPTFPKGGLKRTDVRAIMQFADVVLCPSMSESFGFVQAEAAMSGALLVRNTSMPMSAEIAGSHVLGFPFGSSTHKAEHEDNKKFYAGVAGTIVHCLNFESVIRTKREIRQKYSAKKTWLKVENALHSELGIPIPVGGLKHELAELGV